MELDDDLRWLIALLSDTGMRLGEAVGLLKSDIILDTETPHLNLIPHSWRRLKTSGSERKIPLVGASLWSAKSIKQSDPPINLHSLDTVMSNLIILTQPVQL